MITGVVISLGVIIILLLVVVSLQPPTFQITRSVAIAAPPAVVFAKVNNFQEWNEWSPWAQLDPSMKQTYEGPAEGVGAICSWSGNKKVGEGRMSITESRPNDLVKIRLEFFKPFKATNMAEFSFPNPANQTLVTWTMTGRKNFAAKAFHLIVNMDKMLGSDFEKGLSKMKSISESTSGA